MFTDTLEREILARSDFKYGRQVVILEKNKSAITPELMPVDQLQVFIMGIYNKYA
jgi:hypothetical protein